MENMEEKHLEPELLSIKRYYHSQKRLEKQLKITALTSSFCQTHYWLRNNGKRIKVKSSYQYLFLNSFPNSFYAIKT